MPVYRVPRIMCLQLTRAYTLSLTFILELISFITDSSMLGYKVSFYCGCNFKRNGEPRTQL